MWFVASIACAAAGGLAVAPYANPEDGLLDVVTVHPGSVLELTGVATRLLKGNYVNSDVVSLRRARSVRIESHPGISAFQAASAAAGALIGHDFCCISLSDLLTPREDILKRLDGAARADFVTAFYNPRSQRRTDLIEEAKRIFLAHRPADTPVIIGRQLGRPE